MGCHWSLKRNYELPPSDQFRKRSIPASDKKQGPNKFRYVHKDCHEGDTADGVYQQVLPAGTRKPDLIFVTGMQRCHNPLELPRLTNLLRREGYRVPKVSGLAAAGFLVARAPHAPQCSVMDFQRRDRGEVEWLRLVVPWKQDVTYLIASLPFDHSGGSFTSLRARYARAIAEEIAEYRSPTLLSLATNATTLKELDLLIGASQPALVSERYCVGVLNQGLSRISCTGGSFVYGFFQC